MDALNKNEIEALFISRLPNCSIECSINSDGTLSIDVQSPDANQFTVASIDRHTYLGKDGINRLVREILQEMVLSRQATHLL